MLIDGVHKAIGKIKVDLAPSLGVKGVHLLWCYDLYMNPDGLTSAELASANMIDRSLVSRELDVLKDGGYVEVKGGGSKRGYNARIVLTERGRELAESVKRYAEEFQRAVKTDVPEEDIACFYRTLERFYGNLERVGGSV